MLFCTTVNRTDQLNSGRRIFTIDEIVFLRLTSTGASSVYFYNFNFSNLYCLLDFTFDMVTIVYGL